MGAQGALLLNFGFQGQIPCVDSQAAARAPGLEGDLKGPHSPAPASWLRVTTSPGQTCPQT